MKYLLKVRRNKRQIDLTEVGRVEQHLHALATKDEWLKAKYPEAVICEPYSPQEIKLPVYQREKVKWGQIIINALKREALNLCKI